MTNELSAGDKSFTAWGHYGVGAAGAFVSKWEAERADRNHGRARAPHERFTGHLSIGCSISGALPPFCAANTAARDRLCLRSTICQLGEQLARHPIAIGEKIGMLLHCRAQRDIQGRRENRSDNTEDEGIASAGLITHEIRLVADQGCERVDVARGERGEIDPAVAAEAMTVEAGCISPAQHDLG